MLYDLNITAVQYNKKNQPQVAVTRSFVSTCVYAI